jgi:phage tail sheath protein FI
MRSEQINDWAKNEQTIRLMRRCFEMSPQYLSPGVYVEEVERGAKPIEGVGTAVAGFVGYAESGPINRPTFIANWTQFVDTFGGFLDGFYLAHTVYGYFHNGGGGCYVMRLPAGPKAAEEAVPKATLALPSRAATPLDTLRIEALEPGAPIEVEVAPAAEGAPEDQFTLIVRRGRKEEAFENVTLSKARGARNVVQVVNETSTLVQVLDLEVAGSLAERVPAIGTYQLMPAEAKALAVIEATPELFVGDAAARTGVGGFEAVDEITMICAPDLMAAYQAGGLSKDQVKAVQTAMLAHCEIMKDRFAILDPLPDLSPQEVKEWRMDEAGYDSKYGALYYPWVKVANPARGGELMFMPPSGHLAGIYARSDTERGVHKAPANEVVRGAIGLATQVTKSEQDILNPLGINCVRAFPGRGIRVWGARTLSSDAAWRYINVRRLFNFIEESIEVGTQWVVFEPNDVDLWERVKRDITAFLTRVWRDGALFGTTPAEAFYVKCDEELNPVEVRDAGQLIIEIGLAPVKPAEFVIFRISQWAGGAAVTE